MVTLLLVMLFGINDIALASGKQEGKTVPEKAGESSLATETITFWHPLEGDIVTKSWEALAEKFEKANPGIKVNLQFPAQGSEYGEKIFLSLAGETAPDILRLPSRDRFKMQFSGEKVIVLLNELSSNFEKELNMDDLFPVHRDYNRVNGKWIGFPMWLLVHGLAYNKDLFKESGLDRPPKNWKEVVEFGKKLTRDTNNDGKIDTWGLAPPIGGNPFTGIRWHNYMYSRGLEPYNVDYTKSLYNQPGAVEILQLWVDMYRTHKVINPNIDVSAIGKTYNYFNEGNVGMIVCMSTVGVSTRPFDWDVAEYPGFDGVSPTVRMDAHTLTIFEQSKHKQAAYKFMKFFSETDNYAQVIVNLGNLPSKRSALDHPAWIKHLEGSPYLKAFDRTIRSYTLHPQPMYPAAAEVRPVLANSLQQAVKGLLTPKQALDEATTKVDAILQEARQKGWWKETVW